MQRSVEAKVAKKGKYQEEKRSEKRNWEELNLPAEVNMPSTKKTAREEERKPKNEKPKNEKPVKAIAKQTPPDNQQVEVKFASDDYKNFLEEKAKSAFESLFGNLQMVLDGKIDPVETGLLDGVVGEAGIRESFDRLRSAIRSMPSSIEDELRKEFEETKEKSEKVFLDNVEEVLTNEKEQIEIDPREKDERSKESVLKPRSSEQSNHSVGEKTVTTYICPVSKSCNFILTKVIISFRRQVATSQFSIS